MHTRESMSNRLKAIKNRLVKGYDLEFVIEPLVNHKVMYYENGIKTTDQMGLLLTYHSHGL